METTNQTELKIREYKSRVSYIRWAILAVFVLLSLVIVGMIGCPAYNVYQQRKEGEAQLAHARSSKEVRVMDAKAILESAAMLSSADTLRAHGTARANEIIGSSLTDKYLNWFWIEQLKETQTDKQIIYVPAGPLGMPITEATRLQKERPIPNKEE